jgi:hypothetical protein
MGLTHVHATVYMNCFARNIACCVTAQEACQCSDFTGLAKAPERNLAQHQLALIVA